MRTDPTEAESAFAQNEPLYRSFGRIGIPQYPLLTIPAQSFAEALVTVNARLRVNARALGPFLVVDLHRGLSVRRLDEGTTA